VLDVIKLSIPPKTFPTVVPITDGPKPIAVALIAKLSKVAHLFCNTSILRGYCVEEGRATKKRRAVQKIK
jgi:hypothetical protein